MSQNTQAAAAAKSKFSVRDICYAGLFAAVIAVMAQISIPMPLGVPMTMQTFAITLAAVVLGSKLSAIASLVYLALGAVGVPVLANFSGGFDKFVGPTGGFLISFPLMAYIIGLGVEHRDAFKGAFVTAVIVGTVVNYVVGVAMFVVVAHSTIAVGITVGANFILFSIIGTLVIAVILLVLSFTSNQTGQNYLLVVHYDDRYAKEVTNAVNKMVPRYRLKSKTATRNGVEMTLELRLQGNRSNIVDNLLGIPGVMDATLVAFQNEIA